MTGLSLARSRRRNTPAASGHGGTGTRTSGLVLAALGVVYGDIGTSPLYALRECFRHSSMAGVDPADVHGLLSLILWTLVVVISIQYVAIILRADNQGEGGILALMTLVVRRSEGRVVRRSAFTMLGLAGAALLCADAMITPAISVLSAVEGLSLVTPMFEHFVVPIAAGILIALYLVQHHGTDRIGVVFGPIVLLWFCTLGVLGLASIWQRPDILQAIDPRHGLGFFERHGWLAFPVMGSVFLVVTGGEALYADMGHFGRRPIRLGWFCVALPGLALNYLGQGALLLREPEAVGDLFFHMVPAWGLVPVVVLATCATVIASQAVITGAFSLASQAVNLGYSPRLDIRQTSASAIGQVYVPSINYVFMVGTLTLVFAFRESGALASAYGIAVSGTMLATTVILAGVARQIWGFPRLAAMLFVLPFITIDVVFTAANMLKLGSGGWFPLLVGCAFYLVMTSWRAGRDLLSARLAEDAFPLELLLGSMGGAGTVRVPGTAVFLTGDRTGAPRALLHNLKHNKVLHERILILTVETERVPYVDEDCRGSLDDAGQGVYRGTLHYGFLEQPDVPAALARLCAQHFAYDPMETTYFLGRDSLLLSRTPRSGVSRWRRALFTFMARNAQNAANYFRIPPNRVVELGGQVEI